MQNSWSYIRDSGDFTDKMKRIEKTPEGSFLVTVDVVGLYPQHTTQCRYFVFKTKIRGTTINKDSYS